MGLIDRIRRNRGASAPEPVASAPVAPEPAAASAEPERAHLGPWLDVDAANLTQLADAIDRIYAGTLDGVTLRGVFTVDEVAVGVERSRSFSDEFVDHGKQVMFGTALVGADDERSDYFAGAPVINDRIGSLFDVDFVDRVRSVISSCAGGRPTVVPVEDGKGAYVPATIRFLPPGRGVMHAHTANEFCNVWGAYGHLREIARMWNSLSYFVVGQAPDEGGELVLYDLMWDDTPDDISALGMSEERDALLARYPTTTLSLAAGDMILFTGGRVWHRVAPVEGSRERVTIGGFVALSQDEQQVYFWS